MVVALTTGALGWVPLARAAVTATPSSITFESPSQSITVKLTENGKPVPASAIRSLHLYVDDHDYPEMMRMKRANGVVTLTPTDSVEIGSYRTVIETSRGNAELTVYTPLSDMPNTIEKQAKALGISVDQMREKLGMTGSTGPEILKIDLPPTQYVGQKLNLTLPPAPDRVFHWAVDGKEVKSGKGENTFSTVLNKPGQLVLTVKEIKNGTTLAAASAGMTVAKEPPVPVKVRAGQALIVSATPGFEQHSWSVDGVAVTGDNALHHTFTQPGKHTIECVSRMATSGDPDVFRLVTYDVTVTPK